MICWNTGYNGHDCRGRIGIRNRRFEGVLSHFKPPFLHPAFPHPCRKRREAVWKFAAGLEFQQTATNENGRNQIDIDFERSKIKGTPENDLVNNLKPNTDYSLSNGTKFSTNEHGYFDKISFKPDFDNPGKRDNRQTDVGKEGIDGDVGGHIQACVFGGTCDRYNLFPQNAKFNNSEYKKYFENVIRKTYKEGKEVGNVTVDFYRSNPSSPRPDALTVTYTINGEAKKAYFKNIVGGGIQWYKSKFRYLMNYQNIYILQ